MFRAVTLGWAACIAASGLTGCGGYPRVVRQELDATPEWSSLLGGEGFQAPLAVASSGDGMVMGGVYGHDFAISERAFTNRGGLDGLVASFERNGELRWARELASAYGDDSILALAGSQTGDTFVGGQASQAASFGEYPLNTESPAAAVLAKLDANGEVEWSLTGHGDGYHSVTAIAVTPKGDAYFAGMFGGELDFGTGALTSEGTSDSFLALCNAQGKLQWVQILAGQDIQFVSGLAAGADGEVTVIGGYVAELHIDGETFPKNPLANATPFVARYDAGGKLTWLQSDLLPPEINHVGQVHAEDHHPVGVTDMTLGVAPGGDVTAAVAYGNTFGQDGHDFEATVARNLTATRMDADGNVLVQDTLTSPDAMLFLGTAVAENARVELTVSWTGTLPALGDQPALESDGMRSLAVLDFTSDGRFVPRRTYSVPFVSLTSEGTVRGADGSLFMAVSWRDLETLDRDIFLARFR